MTITNTLKKKKSLSKKEMAAKLWPHFPKRSQIKTFQAQYGKTIAAWQLVEMYLQEVYRATICSSRPRALAASFHSIQGFRTQLGITDVAIKFAFHNDNILLNAWKAIYTKADNKSGWRNAIVHGMIYIEFQEPRKDHKIHIGPVLTDPRNKIPPKKQPNNKREPLTIQRLRQYEKDFRNLARSMKELSLHIPPP